MTVYVDPLTKATEPTRKWPYPEFSHLVADALPELHEFAKRLGLKPAWFQDSVIPHYDLSAGKRAQAINLGAQSVTLKDLAVLIGRWRRKITGKEVK